MGSVCLVVLCWLNRGGWQGWALCRFLWLLFFSIKAATSQLTRPPISLN